MTTNIGGLKYDGDKPRMDLLDHSYLMGTAAVLTFGAQKYAAHNWREGLQVSRLTAAAMRHLSAFNNGEDLDPESGLSHLYHASCCLMFASVMVTERPELDDRYKRPEQRKIPEEIVQHLLAEAPYRDVRDNRFLWARVRENSKGAVRKIRVEAAFAREYTKQKKLVEPTMNTALYAISVHQRSDGIYYKAE